MSVLTVFLHIYSCSFAPLEPVLLSNAMDECGRLYLCIAGSVTANCVMLFCLLYFFMRHRLRHGNRQNSLYEPGLHVPGLHVPERRVPERRLPDCTMLRFCFSALMRHGPNQRSTKYSIDEPNLSVG